MESQVRVGRGCFGLDNYEMSTTNLMPLSPGQEHLVCFEIHLFFLYVADMDSTVERKGGRG